MTTKPDSDLPATSNLWEPRADQRAETRRAYDYDWSRFASWCRANGQAAFPAADETLRAHIASLALSHSSGTVKRRIAAIKDRHRRAGEHIPEISRGEQIEARRGAEKTPTSRQIPFPEAKRLVELALTKPKDMRGLRDRALLLLAAELGGRNRPGRIPRTALLSLLAEDIQATTEGLALRFRAGPSLSQESTLQLTAREPAVCVVAALQTWLETSGASFGPVFRRVDRWGNVEHTALSALAWPGLLRPERPARKKARRQPSGAAQ